MSITVIDEGDNQIVVAPAGDAAAFAKAAADATAVGVVGTVTTPSGVGLVMSRAVAQKAGLVKARRSSTKQTKEEDK